MSSILGAKVVKIYKIRKFLGYYIRVDRKNYLLALIGQKSYKSNYYRLFRPVTRYSVINCHRSFVETGLQQ